MTYGAGQRLAIRIAAQPVVRRLTGTERARPGCPYDHEGYEQREPRLRITIEQERHTRRGLRDQSTAAARFRAREPPLDCVLLDDWSAAVGPDSRWILSSHVYVAIVRALPGQADIHIPLVSTSQPFSAWIHSPTSTPERVAISESGRLSGLIWSDIQKDMGLHA